MWTVSVGGRPLGSYSEPQIVQMIQAGQLREAWIAPQGTENWMPLHQNPAFAAALQSGQSMQGQPMHGQAMQGHPPVHGQQAFQQPGGHGPARAVAKGSSVGLVIGIVAGVLTLIVVGIVVVVRAREAPAAAAPTTPTAPARTIDGVIAPRKARIEAKLATALRIAGSVPRPSARDAVKPERGPIVLLVGKTDVVGKGDAQTRAGTATLVHLEDLSGDVSTRGNLPYASGEALLHDCAAIIHKKPPSSTFAPESDLAATEVVLDQCLSLRHLLLIRTQKSGEPLVDAANSKYVPGFIEGDILVFDLDSGKHLGGYRFAARNGATLEVNLADPVRDLRLDVSKKLWGSIRDGLARSDPSSRVVNVY
jgi:hypothetical protein